jgi:hypothetical protein
VGGAAERWDAGVVDQAAGDGDELGPDGAGDGQLLGRMQLAE